MSLGGQLGGPLGRRQSIGQSASPSAAGILGQFLTLDPGSVDVPVPSGAYWVFAEAMGRGGTASNPSSGGYGAGGGAAGADAIFAVQPGLALNISLDEQTTNPAATVISYQGAPLVTANSAPANASQNGGVAGGSGKYPGGVTTGSSPEIYPGKGGGRLAGRIATRTLIPGPGSGGKQADTNVKYGGLPCVCLTFFSSYEDALAFAKSVYNGTWAP